MELDYFKDTVFELLNNSDSIAIKDIHTKDKENLFTILLADGSRFELECRQIEKRRFAEKQTATNKKQGQKAYI